MLGCLAASAKTALAWNPAGHMAVASLAYGELSPDSQARMLSILEAHPAFAQWKEASMVLPGPELARDVFMLAAKWPDDIRKSGSPFDHPVWHYVDFPLVPPDFPLEEPPGDTENILTAIASCEKTLADHTTPAVDRAAALSWLIHLVGDVMQPLHGATMISPAHPRPAGDRGGNLFFVDLAGSSINLHAYWDNLGGSVRGVPEAAAHGGRLKTSYPRAALPELAAAKEPRGWALESRQLALDAVYRRGTLPGTDQPHTAPPPLPPDYSPGARTLAERRLALAAYRLADELTRLKP